MARLDTLSASTANALNGASAEQLRRACVLACEIALTDSLVDCPLAWESLGRLRAGDTPTSSETASLDAIVARLDEEYFDIQKASESGKGTPMDARRAFAKARAVAAVSFAIVNTPDAASEAIYEAAAAVGNARTQLFARIESELARRDP